MLSKAVDYFFDLNTKIENVVNLRTYLFDVDSTGSYAYALQALTGNGKKAEYIRDLLAGERVVFGTGENAISMSIPSYKKLKQVTDMKTLDIPFKQQLERFFPREDMVDGTALLATSKRFADAEPKMLSKAVDYFFDLNTKIELPCMNFRKFYLDAESISLFKF